MKFNKYEKIVFSQSIGQKQTLSNPLNFQPLASIMVSIMCVNRIQLIPSLFLSYHSEPILAIQYIHTYCHLCVSIAFRLLWTDTYRYFLKAPRKFLLAKIFYGSINKYSTCSLWLILSITLQMSAYPIPHQLYTFDDSIWFVPFLSLFLKVYFFLYEN